MTIQSIETHLLKHLPKESMPFVVWLDHSKHGRGSTYFLTYGDTDGHELSAEPSDTVSELRWNARVTWEQFKNGTRDN